MLDTPSYFDSKWTRDELVRALTMGILVLRLVWPKHQPNRSTDIAETIYLEPDDLAGPDGPIRDCKANQIVLFVESLRTRSIAARYLSIIGRLRADLLKFDGEIEGIGTHHAVSIRLPDDRRICAYPITGVPTAKNLNEIADNAISHGQQNGVPVLLYDHIGIHSGWSKHLEWLDDNIKTVRMMKITEAGWSLAAYED
ncbi:MAG: hypothetical protein OXC62_03795 [Aestuariivita sp.]|nr:hypothetical protein [Aestuariivita sp.]